MSDESLSSRRPYLIRAMHEWMADNGQTPHIVVDAGDAGVEIPPGHARDGRIVLNISNTATRDLMLGNEIIAFEARFGGSPFFIKLPVNAVLGIYARESGQGMIFSGEGSGPNPPAGPSDEQPNGDGNARSHLRVVK